MRIVATFLLIYSLQVAISVQSPYGYEIKTTDDSISDDEPPPPYWYQDDMKTTDNYNSPSKEEQPMQSYADKNDMETTDNYNPPSVDGQSIQPDAYPQYKYKHESPDGTYKYSHDSHDDTHESHEIKTSNDESEPPMAPYRYESYDMDTTIATDAPWSAEPLQCTDKCDAFGIRMKKYSRQNGDICITYEVQRFFDYWDGTLCDGSLKYAVLGTCTYDFDSDGMSDVDATDLNGLMENCTIYHNHQYHSHSHSHDHSHDHSSSSKGFHKDRKTCHGVDSDGFIGILIKLKPEDEIEFEICLKDVFVDTFEISNNVRFRRGYNKYTCDNDWIEGLPCIDDNKFVSGAYDYSGFNYGYYKKKKKGKGKGKGKGKAKGSKGHHSHSHSDSAAEWDIRYGDNNLLNEVSPIAKWEVLSCIILICFCLIGVCVHLICILRRKRKLKEKGESVKTFDESDVECNYNESDDRANRRKYQTVMSGDEN